MKTSHSLFVLLVPLLWWGDAAAFAPITGAVASSSSRFDTHNNNNNSNNRNLNSRNKRVRSSTSSTGATAKLHLYTGWFQHQTNINPKQELLNNRHSASDWLYNVKSLPQSGVLKEIRNPVLSAFSWACAVSVVQHCLARSKVDWLRTVASKMCIASSAHSYLVSALGLLLVFRTNSAYQRFNEGRKIWEHILSLSRNLTRMIQLYSTEVGADRKARMMKLVAAYPYLLRHHIRPGCFCNERHEAIDPQHRLLLREPSRFAVETRHDGDKQCPGGTTEFEVVEKNKSRRECWVDRRKLPWSLFPEAALLKVAKARNRPLWVCDRLGREVMNIPYGENFTSRERLSMLGSIEKLTNAVGECERIHQTAVPLNYARHSLRSLTLWLFTLPFALVKDMGLLTGPVTACTAWLLFGVYQIGYSIEDPFQGSLRLSLLCDAIRRDVMEVSEAEDDGRDSAYSLEASQVLTDMDSSPKEDLVTALSAGAAQHEFTNSSFEVGPGASMMQHQILNLDLTGEKVIIDPNLINPPQFVERDGKLFVIANGANGTEFSEPSF